MITVEEAIEELNKYEEEFKDSTFEHIFFSFLFKDGRRRLHGFAPNKEAAVGCLFDKVELYGYEIEDIVTSTRLSGRQIGMSRLFPSLDLDVHIMLKRGAE